MALTVLAVASRAVLEGCARLGIPAGELLAAAGIAPGALDDPDARLDAARADELWRLAYQRSGDPLLALHAAEQLSFGAYRVVDFLVANSATAGEGLERVARYFAIIDPRGRLEVRGGEPRQLVMRTAVAGELPAPAQEYTLRSSSIRVRRLVGARWRPEAVEFTFPAPADPAEHRRIFGVPVRFGRREARVLFSNGAWGSPIRGAQADLLQILEDYARRRLREAPRHSALVEKCAQR
jgi:hypothetical protein